MKNSTKNVIIIVLSTLLVSVIAGFYFFTKSFERPKLNRMELTFPESGVASIKKDPKNSISVLMAKNNRVFWYRNETNPIKLNESSYSKLENVLINTCVNLLALYSNERDNHSYFEKALKILENLKPEKNNITERWKNLGLEIKTAFDSQAVIEQFNNFCTHKKCLNCAIGSEIMRK